MKPISLLLATIASIGLANPIEAGSQLDIMGRQSQDMAISEILPPSDNSTGDSGEKRMMAKGHHHKHTVADFRRSCDCPPAICPKELMDDKSRCQCENAASIACYMKTNGGCGKPEKKC